MSYTTTRCLVTGTTMTVCRAEDEGFYPDDGKWVTICNAHSTIVHSATREQAVAASRFPDFCDECREKLWVPAPPHQTRAVLAGAYPGRDPGATRHTHTARVSVTGEVLTVLCDQVQTRHLADTHASDIIAIPTCPACRRKDPRFPLGD